MAQLLDQPEAALAVQAERLCARGFLRLAGQTATSSATT